MKNQQHSLLFIFLLYIFKMKTTFANMQLCNNWSFLFIVKVFYMRLHTTDFLITIITCIQVSFIVYGPNVNALDAQFDQPKFAVICQVICIFQDHIFVISKSSKHVSIFLTNWKSIAFFHIFFLPTLFGSSSVVTSYFKK